MRQAGFERQVSKSAIAIVFEQVGGRSLAGGKSFEARTVHEKDIQPAIVVVVVESDTAAGCFEQIFIFVLAAENCFGVQAGFASYIDKCKSEGSSRCRIRDPIAVGVALRIRRWRLSPGR